MELKRKQVEADLRTTLESLQRLATRLLDSGREEWRHWRYEMDRRERRDTDTRYRTHTPPTDAVRPTDEARDALDERDEPRDGGRYGRHEAEARYYRGAAFDGGGYGRGREYRPGGSGGSLHGLGESADQNLGQGSYGQPWLGQGGYGQGGRAAAGQRRAGQRGRGPRHYVRPDWRIADDLHQRLTDDDELDAGEIAVRVQDGVVTLQGTVEERWMKHRAEDIAARCSGVRDIRNEIRVVPAGQRSGSDEAARLAGAPGAAQPQARRPA